MITMLLAPSARNSSLEGSCIEVETNHIFQVMSVAPLPVSISIPPASAFRVRGMFVLLSANVTVLKHPWRKWRSICRTPFCNRRC